MAQPRNPGRRPGASSTLKLVQAAGSREAEVLIYDVIDSWFGVDANQLVKDLKGLDVDTIHVRINSPGGSVFDGIAIFNALKEHKAKVVTHVDALAASIASVIALAGDEVEMADNAMFMIHNAWILAIGDAAELRKTADLLDKISDASIVRTYAAKTGADEDQIREWMNEETWFTAEEAKDEGFIDVIAARSESQAKVDPAILAQFKRAPAALLAAAPATQPPQSIREFETALREKCGFSHAAARAIAAGGFKAPSDPRDEDEPGQSFEPFADLATAIRSLATR